MFILNPNLNKTNKKQSRYTLFLLKDSIAFNKETQKYIENSKELLFITYNEVLHEFDTSNISKKYISIDYSKADDYKYRLILEIIDELELPDKFQPIAKCIFLKINDYFSPLLHYVYVIRYIVDTLNISNINIVVNDKRLSSFLQELFEYNIVFNKVVYNKKEHNYYNLLLDVIKGLWIEQYIIHLINMIKITKRQTYRCKKYDYVALFDIYNQSAISKLNLYLDKSFNNNKILKIVKDQRIYQLSKNISCNNTDYIYLTSLISLKNIARIFINIILVAKANYFQKNKTKSKLYQLIPKFRLSMYLALAWCEYKSYLDFLLKNNSIKDVVSATGIHYNSYLLIQATKERHINSTVVQHGYPIDKVGFLPIESSQFIVYNHNVTNIFRSWGVENIKYSDFIQIDDQKTHDYDGEEILVCLSASYYDNHRIFNLLKQYNQNTKSSNIFRIRKHPGSYRISMIDNNWVHQTDGVVFDKYSNCEDSIRNSIGVIASYSSVIQEAHEMNVPVILISDLVKRSNFNFKNIFNIETYTEFNIAIKNILMIFGNKKC